MKIKNFCSMHELKSFKVLMKLERLIHFLHKVGREPSQFPCEAQFIDGPGLIDHHF